MSRAKDVSYCEIEHHPGLKVLTGNTSRNISWIPILSSLNHLYHIEPDLTPNIHSLHAWLPAELAGCPSTQFSSLIIHVT